MSEKKLWIEGDALKVLLALGRLQPEDLVRVSAFATDPPYLRKAFGEEKTWVVHSQDSDPFMPVNLIPYRGTHASRRARLSDPAGWTEACALQNIVALHRPSK